MGRQSKKVEVYTGVHSAVIPIKDSGIVCEIAGDKPDGSRGPTCCDEGEVDSTSSTMSWFFGNIARWNDILFVNERVELCFSFVVFWSLTPPHKVIDCLLGSIGIIDYDCISSNQTFLLNLGQCLCCLLGENGSVAIVPINHLSNKVARYSVASRNQNCWVDVSDVVEGVWHLVAHHHRCWYCHH